MTSQKQQQVKVLEDSRIARPPGSVPPSSLPLTFFDIYVFICPLFQRIFFYELPRPRSAFLNTHLPDLKHSLSLALQIFYPLAGRLVPGQDGGVPVISYSDGDFVILTVVECDDDIHYLAGNQPQLV